MHKTNKNKPTAWFDVLGPINEMTIKLSNEKPDFNKTGHQVLHVRRSNTISNKDRLAIDGLELQN